MIVKLSPPFQYGTRVTSLGPGHLSMTTVVRAVFRLRPDEPVTAIEGPVDQGFLSGDRFRDDDEERTGELLHADDFADFKLTSDVLLRGTAHAGEGRKTHELDVTFTVGSWRKTLHVFGRRVWTENPLDPISQPMAFAEMPLTYAQAFGGPGFARNPVGMGHGSPELPNVEDPRALLRSKGSSPAPAAFGPINPGWPQRAGKRGTQYGKAWRETRAPFYAADFDWSFFQAAPADQQLPGYLRGNEELSFENLHPRARHFTARLPDLLPVVLVRYADGATREPTMHLDTLVADVDAGRLVLVWRGLVPVQHDDLADVRALFIAGEPLSDPRTRAEYEAQLDAFERDPLEHDKVLSPEVRRKIDEAQAMAAKAKADATEAAEAAATRKAPPRDALAWLASALATHADILAPEEQQAAAKSVDMLRAARDKAMAERAELKKKGQEPPAAPKRDGVEDLLIATLGAQKSAAAARGLPVDRFDATTSKLVEMRDRRRAAEAELLARSRTDPSVLPTLGSLDASDAEAAETAPDADPAPPPPPAPSPGRGANLMGHDLSGRDLRGADLEGALLRKANLSGAKLGGANLRQADLTGADLTEANLTRANLSRAVARGAIFDGATLDQAMLTKADLTGASMAGVKVRLAAFTETILTDARLTRAHLHKVVFNGARLEKADFSEAVLEVCLFLSVEAPGLRLDSASLTRTGFLRSRLRGASLVEARGPGNSWQEARLEDADFSHADLPSASFANAFLDRAKFFGARLRRARFQRASLDQADFSRADCLSAVFNKARLADTKFVGANLFDAKLLGATASEKCDFRDANLKRAMWKQPG